MPSFRVLEVLGQLLLGLLVGSVSVLLFADRRTPVPPPLPIALIALGVGVLVGVLFAGAMLLVRRRQGTGREVVRHAVRTGRLPEDVDDATLGRLLRQRRERLLGYRWTWPVLAVLQTAVGVLQLLGPRTTAYGRIGWTVDVVVWIGAAIAFGVVSRRDLPVTGRLLAELEDRSVPSGPQDRSTSS